MIFYSTIITSKGFMSDLFLKRLKKNYLQFFYIKKIFEKKKKIHRCGKGFSKAYIEERVSEYKID